MGTDLARRRALLTAALGFALLDTRGKPVPPEQTMIQEVARQLDGPRARRDGDAAPMLPAVVDGLDGSTWRATFGSSPMLSSDGFGTPVAAWEALAKTPGEEQGPVPAEEGIRP